MSEIKYNSDIRNFLGTFSKTEVARPCNFDVVITPTNPVFALDLMVAAGLDGEDPASAWKKMKFHCEAAELPSRTFSAVTQKLYGPEILHPIQNSYNKINLTFICSDNMIERWIFEYWMNYMSNASFFPFQIGIEDVVDLFTDGPVVNYDFKYKNQYESFILITQYNVKGDASYWVGLFHAFPISLNEMPLSWENGNAIHKLTVTFAYTYYNAAIPLGGSIPFPVF